MNNPKEAKPSIKYIYTPLSEAKKLIVERFANEELKKKVLKFCGSVPEVITKEPRVVVSRPIATPNFEFEYFLDLARETGLSPLIFEYPDKLVARNTLKYHLCKLQVLDRSKKNYKKITSHSPVDFNVWEGKPLSQIMTKENRSLLGNHHDLLFAVHPEMKDKIYDFSDWFKKTRGKTNEDYYVAFLSLFVCFGIFFENYLLNDPSEKDFILAKVIPSFEKVQQLFGVKPIICPLLPLKDERSIEWHWYDQKHNQVIKKIFL